MLRLDGDCISIEANPIQQESQKSKIKIRLQSHWDVTRQKNQHKCIEVRDWFSH